MTVPPPPPGPWPPPPAPPTRTNGLAIASLIGAFLVAPFGIVFGHLSLAQIRRSGEPGRGLAIAGLAIGYVLTGVAVIAAVIAMVFSVVAVRHAAQPPGPVDMAPSPTAASSTPAAVSDGKLPPFGPRADVGADCQYPASGSAAKPNTPPRSGPVPREPATVAASMATDQGNIGLNLANGQAPCTVNNFASLAQQGYFDGTTCHRLTTGSLAVLQCGDPTGTGTGGPGYQFADEYPVTQTNGNLDPVSYPRGTLAMANSGPDTNGSQFFLVYGDSQLPPGYTVFGTIDATGLATLDKIAAGGVAGGGSDGKPAVPVTISSIRLD